MTDGMIESAESFLDSYDSLVHTEPPPVIKRRGRKPKSPAPFDLTVSPPSKLTHPSRAFTDFDLRTHVKPLVLTPEKLRFLVDYIKTVVGRHDDAMRDIDPHILAATLARAAPYALELGDWGGVVSLLPCNPGHAAMLHIYIWNPLYLRRPAGGRAVLRYLMKKWSLRRIFTIIPVTSTLANRYARSVGMTLDGRIRHAFEYNGQGMDGNYMSILPGEV